MKKILPLCCAIVLACACTVEENSEDTASRASLKEIRVEATISDDNSAGATKTALGAGGKVLWSSGDKISLLNVSGTPSNAELTLSSGSGATTASFTGEAVDCAEGYYGVYPYNAGHELKSDGALYIEWYGNNQLAVKDGADLGRAMMTGSGSLERLCHLRILVQ